MSPHPLPGWTMPNGHRVRSHAEAALCDFLEASHVAHAHSAQTFNVPIGTGQLRLYSPSITLTEITKDGGTILIEPIDSLAPGSGLRRIQSLRKTRGPDYFIVIVARRSLHARVPEDAYDAIFPLEDFNPLAQFLRGLL